jgi:hypothetical protein
MFESCPESAGEPDPGGAADDAGLGDAWADREWPSDFDEQDAPPLPDGEEFVSPTPVEWLESARAAQAGVGQLSSLVDVDVADLSADDVITALQEAQRAAAWSAGFETQLRAQVTVKVWRKFSRFSRRTRPRADRRTCVRSRWRGVRSRPLFGGLRSRASPGSWRRRS